MNTNQTLKSHAEIKAKKCLKFDFCKSLNLESIKEKLTPMLNHIGDNGMFAEYTMHDITHVNGMLDLLDKIIPEVTKKTMTPADWLMVVLSIYFHDLGMFIPAGEYDNRNSNKDFISFKTMMLKDDEIKYYVHNLDGEKGEKFLYQEYVRRNHGERVHEWICNCDKKKTEPYKLVSEMLSGLDTAFRTDMALICKSHQMDELPDHLKSVDEAYGASEEEKVNLLYASVLLRSVDILHMTHDRTPDIEYRIISPQNKISVIEWAKQRAVRSVDVHFEKDDQGKVDKSIPTHSFEIQAKFTDDIGYFSFKTFLDYVKIELKRCHKWCEESRSINSNQYLFPWYDIDTSRVQADGFLNKKLKFEIDQENILKLLTGHTLYNDSTVVLRELIQNAMDAGKLQDSKSKASSTYQCKVNISWNSKTRILRVADNATGMDLDTITNYLLRVGASKYQSEIFKKNYPDFNSISRFGIGLLTCFLISDDVDIYTFDEEEKQCHLLKIRNLNGEYLMRNDADPSNILEGEHGTTFELKVRSDVNLDNIEQQIRQWIIIPFGKIALTVDGTDTITIGYDSVKEAIEGYVSKLSGVDLVSGKYRVFSKSHNGVDLAFLQYYNQIMKVWYMYHYDDSDYMTDAPIGISVEGVKVTSASPGLSSRSYLALANCVGKNSPTTNVARNDLEDGAAVDSMYETIYELYIDSFVSQIDTLKTDYSLIWSTTEVNHLIEAFYSSRLYGRYEKKEILWKVLRNAKCIPIDTGKEICLASINSLPDIVTTIDSRAFTAAVSLLKDMNIADKTAYGLLSELEKHSINGEIILPIESVANCIYNLFLDDYEVISIDVDEKNRRIIFSWAKQTEKWKHFKVHRVHSVAHLFVLLDENEVKIKGMENKDTIVSNQCIYLTNDSPLRRFMHRVVNDLKIDCDILDILCDLVCQAIMDVEVKNEQSIDNFLSSDENYLKKAFFDKFTKEELIEALNSCRDNVVNIEKYYREYL